MDLLRRSALIALLSVAVATDSQTSTVPVAMGRLASVARLPVGPAPLDRRAEPIVSNPPPRSWTTVETEVVEWAYGQFEAAGLDLPAVAIAFSADADDCAGEQGIYRRRSSGEHEVTVCVPDLEGAAIDHRRRRTLLHELAHVWDHATLTAADREQLLPALEATDWYDPENTWDRRGVERFAETLTWGLLEQRRRPLKIDTRCADVHADFITITGSEALGPIDRICETDTARTYRH